MTPQEFVDLQKDVARMTEEVEQVHKILKGIRLFNQHVIQENKPISPGIAVKIAYDYKGLVLQGMSLEEGDIPELSIDKIQGLRNIFDEIDKRLPPKERKKTTEIPKKDPLLPQGTGLKFNVDENGKINSYIDHLTVNDIPELPISKVQGLRDQLTLLTSSRREGVPSESLEAINPGTACKITYDKDGRVKNGTSLQLEDVPITLINRISLLEDSYSRFMTREAMEGLQKEINDRIPTIGKITPGTFTKVRVNDDGLILSGEEMTLRDLPTIEIRDIPGLEKIIHQKAEQEELVRLSNTVSSMIEGGQRAEIQYIRSQLKDTATKGDIQVVKKEISSIEEKLEKFRDQLPNENFMMIFNEIKDNISTLVGRVTTIEKKIKLSDDFDLD